MQVKAILAAALAGLSTFCGGEELFNGRDLTGWHVFLRGRKPGEDPKGVFSVRDGAIRVTGEEWGSAITDREYADYRLTVEYRFTGRKWPSKKNSALDSGILFHSVGKDGGFAGIWMASHEYNLIQGASGDIWGVHPAGSGMSFTGAVADEKTDGGRAFVWKEGGREEKFSGNVRLARCDIDPKWTDRSDAPLARNERKVGEWNTAVLECRGATATCFFNGRRVNQATRLNPARGRIQLQSEGCEIEFRRVTLEDLAADRPWVSDEEKLATVTRVDSIDFQPGTPESDATAFWRDRAKTEGAFANYDESKAGVPGKDFQLEDPLTFADGRPVRNAADWEERRKEILGILEQCEYGVMPPKPATSVVELVSEKLTETRFAKERRYRQYFRADKTGPVIDWLMYVPVHAVGRVPVILHLNYTPNEKTAATLSTNHYRLPVDEMISRGYAYMTAFYRQITDDPHSDEEFSRNVYNGVYELWGRRDPKRTDLTGALIAWAWGLCRGLDLAETVPEIDATRNMVIGSSRLGKAALLAGAFDTRFVVTVPNQTGGGGVDLMKHKYAEDANIMSMTFPHWFCSKFWTWKGDQTKQPFDQHLLLAAVAPRALLLECYHKKWFDPYGEFLAAKAAAPVWKLLCGRTFDAPAMPDPYTDDCVVPPFGYARRTECHGIAPDDWRWALDFADKVMPKRPELPLQREIDAAAAKGGGVVRVPAGRWIVRPLVLKSNVTLDLAEGAYLYATTNLADYATAPGTRCFIYAENADNVAITGKGVLDARGSAFRERRGLAGESQPQDLPVMMRFSRCRNVTLEDFTYRNGGAWGCHLRNCDGVAVRRVKCFSHVNNTNDGIDIESSNVVVEDCDIDSDDDAIVFKTESDKTFQVTNVVIRNCRLASCCNALKFGTGSYCDFRDIRIENCRFERAGGNFRFNWKKTFASRGVKADITGLCGMALEVVDGGRMENVTIRNVTVDGYMVPMFFRLARRHEAADPRGSYMRNILVENVTATCADSRNGCSVTGVPGLRPSDITLRNVTLVFPGGGTERERDLKVGEFEKGYPEATMFGRNLPAWGFFIRHADNIALDNVKMSTAAPDARDQVVRIDSK